MSNMADGFKRSMEGLAELEQSIEKLKVKRYAQGYTEGVSAGIDLVLRTLVEVGMIDEAAADENRARMAELIEGLDLDGMIETALS